MLNVIVATVELSNPKQQLPSAFKITIICHKYSTLSEICPPGRSPLYKLPRDFRAALAGPAGSPCATEVSASSRPGLGPDPLERPAFSHDQHRLLMPLLFK